MLARTSRSLAFALLFVPCALVAQISYPATQKGTQADVYHGTSIADPYRWLEDPDSPPTRAWIEAQNKVTFGYLGSITERAGIHDRLTRAWNYPKYGVPFVEAGRMFWFENTGLQNQSVLYVQDSATGRGKARRVPKARVLLDPNTLSTDGTVALNSLALDEKATKLAYGISVGGSDWQ